MTEQSAPSTSPDLLSRVFGVVTILVGLLMAVPGAYLMSLGGSWYYAVAGIVLILAGISYWRGEAIGPLLYLVAFFGTLAWAVWEVGFSLWPLVPRLVAPMVLTAIALALAPRFLERYWSWPAYGVAAGLAAGVVAMFWGMFQPQGVIRNAFDGRGQVMAATMALGEEWHNYGRTPNGTRFAPFDQITPENVSQLEVLWTHRTGDPPSKTGQDQNTPIYANGLVYHCSPHNKVTALNGETGEMVWRFDPEAASPLWQRCRGVTYYETADPQCSRRIALTTVDARLISLNADTGTPCAGFGTENSVDLTRNMGEVRPGFYFPTSAPTVMDGRIIIGGWVWDGMAVDEPSGVVRAFDAVTGDLVWAWDLGNPAIDTVPPPGETYTRGTPNVWSTPSFDTDLGLVYLPTGNAQPDFYGSARDESAHEYNSSIVALDAVTGKVRWHFQTTRRDIWDYDVPSQPLLYDLPDGAGGTTPALIQLTKRGQIFMFDRRNGTPLHEIEDRPVPTEGGAEPDFMSPTQPYPVGVPSIGTEPLSERRMWGATPLDQLYCRIQFRLNDYVGDFTPLSERGTLIWPGYFGGMNWGTATVDESRGLLIVNDSRIVHRVQLIARETADRLGADLVGPHDGMAPQDGAPFAAMRSNFLSFVGVPCQEPPFGTITAINLQNRQIVWQAPVGTVEETGPFGIRTGWRMPVGMPLVGGPMSTAGGLTFYAGTQDYYLRAFNSETGEELWRGALPVGSQATPMSYRTPNGRQIVVVAAGGLSDHQGRGDYVIAFALPAE